MIQILLPYSNNEHFLQQSFRMFAFYFPLLLQIMNIQNKEFLLNLAKIELMKFKIIRGFPFRIISQALNTIFLIFFILSNAGVQFQSFSFSFAKQLSYRIQKEQLLYKVPLGVLLLTSSTVLGCLFFLSQHKENINQKYKKTSIHVQIRTLTAISLIIFQISCIPLLVAICSSPEGNDQSLTEADTFSIICFIFSQAIISICKIQVAFKNKLILVFMVISFLPPLSTNCIALIMTLYQIRCIQQPKNLQRLAYFLLLVIFFICLCGEYFQEDVSNFQQVIIISSIIIIERLLPISQDKISKQSQNQTIIQTLSKMEKEEMLSNKSMMKILSFFERMSIKLSSLDKELGHNLKQKHHIDQLEHITSNDLNRKGLIRLFQLKLDVEGQLEPNNLSFKIQQYECILLEKDLSISELYQIQVLTEKVLNNSNYDELVRLEKLKAKIEKQFMRGESRINAQLILHLERLLEEFYKNVGNAAQNMLTLWKALFRRQIKEQTFDYFLEKAMVSEERSMKILQQLKNHKSYSLQIDIMNYLHKIINANASNILQKKTVYQYEQIRETHFLLTENNIIYGASLTVLKKIAPCQEERLIETYLSDLLYNFYSMYLEAEINRMTSASQSLETFLIAFKALNYKFKFSLFQCNIRVIPDFSSGVKCIYQFLDQKQDIKKFCLYCLEDDQIHGLSQTFYQKFKVDDSSLPAALYGQNLFNVDISEHIDGQNIPKNLIIKGELSLNNLRKKTIKSKKNPRVSLNLTVREVYKVKGLNYILFEVTTFEETMLITRKTTLQLFVTQRNQLGRNTTIGPKETKFCKIHNPLSTMIDERLAKTSNNNGLNYLKAVIIMIIFIMIIATGTLILVKMETSRAGNIFKQQMDIVDNTNRLIQQTYSLFYQYYQYYQIISYPQHFMSIQHYNMTEIAAEYKEKVNQNIFTLTELLLYNKNNYNSLQLNLYFQKFMLVQTTSKQSLIYFLQGVKEALSTGSPIFMIRNEPAIYNIINSFINLDSSAISQISQQMNLYVAIALSAIVLLSIAIKILNFRVSLFKWTILSVYSEGGAEERKEHVERLHNFITVLTNHQYYDKDSMNVVDSKYMIETSNELDHKQYDSSQHLAQSPIQNEEEKKETCYGIKRSTYIDKLLSKNLLFLVVIVFLAAWIIYHQNMQQFIQQSNTILKYSNELQNSSALILQRGTSFYQNAMISLLPESQRQEIAKQELFILSTQIELPLPSHFQQYKEFQKSMLNYNLCEYSYLNTGSLYRGINCAMVLDGMMNRGFTETYAFLLQHIEALRGAALPALGTQLRPSAQYPFFMEVCYARRTINNMLTVVQSRFAVAVNGFLEAKQTSLHSAVAAGFALLPLALGVFWMFARRLRSDCEKAIKCFRILPRSFIMKISISKRLNNLGALQQIENVIP